jgi:PAS domain S-box-containing protein
MIWQSTPYTVPLIAASVASVMLGLYILYRYRWPGNKLGALAIFVNTEWILGYAFEIASSTLSAMILWDKVQFGAIIVLPTVWFVYILYYTSHEKWLTRSALTALSTVPVITFVLALTNTAHQLIWTSYTLKEGPFLLLDKTYGLWYWGYVTYGFLLFLSGVILLTRTLLRSHHLYRWQAGALLFGGLAPVAAAVLVLSGLNPFPYLNLVPVTFVITNVTVAFSIIYFKLGDIVPLARETVIESMRDSVIIVDTEARIVDVNSSARSLMGMSVVIGTPLAAWDLWSQIESAKLTEGDKEIVVSHKESIYDVEISPLMSRHGRPIGKAVVLRDITDRKRVEEAERYRLLAENVNDVIWTMDMNLQFTYISPSVSHLRGYTAEEVMHQSLDEVLTPSSLEFALETFEKELSREKLDLSRSVTIELEHLCKDNTTVWAEVKVTGLQNEEGDLIGMLGVSRDITERKRAEKEIIKFKTIFDSAAYGSAILTLERKFIYVNEAFAQMHQYTPQDIIGKDVTFLHAAEHITVVKKLQEQLKTKGVYTAEEVWHQRKDTTVFPTLMSGTLIKDEKGTPLFIGITAVDITERKMAEEKIKASLKEKEVLLQEVHHRVKNNLQIISSLLSLQSHYIKDQSYAHMLKESQNRIKSMALIHEKLYQSENLAYINVCDYIKTLAQTLLQSYNMTDIALTLTVDNVSHFLIKKVK